MTRKLITFGASSEPQLPSDTSEVERFDFGDLSAALVDTEAASNQIASAQGVHDAEDESGFEAHPLTAPETAGSTDYATIDDVRRVSAVPDTDLTGKGVAVAVMDSGIDDTHPILEGKQIPQHDMTDSTGESRDTLGHGTACTGQIARLAPDVELVSLRIFGSQGTAGMRPILRAYQWLAQNADAIDIANMSWGSTRSSSQLNKIHNHVVSKGVRDTSSAGNTGSSGGSPATASRAFSVGACTESGELAEFSSYNPEQGNPDVVAVGEACRLARAEGTSMGTVLSDEFVSASGTSFSAPAVAGMVALYLEAKQMNPSVDQIMSDFREHASDLEGNHDGAGIAQLAPMIDFDDGSGDGEESDDGSDGSDGGQSSLNFLYRGEAQVDHVEDGDTWHGKHRCSPQYVTARRPREDSDYPAGQWYRLTGIDTHETGGENAEKAAEEKQFVEQFVAKGRENSDSNYPFVIEFDDADNEVEGDYGRLLVDLRRKSDGQSLAEALVSEFGDGVKYQGAALDQLREFVADELPIEK